MIMWSAVQNLPTTLRPMGRQAGETASIDRRRDRVKVEAFRGGLPVPRTNLAVLRRRAEPGGVRPRRHDDPLAAGGTPYARAMFTGIVEHQGEVRSVDASATGATLLIDPRGWSHRPSDGDSISVNGCCLTIRAPRDDERATDGWRFDAIPQTLAMTTLGALRAGDRVNLEHAATPTTLLGGHMVQGHVDGVATVATIRTDGEWRVRFAPPAELLPLINPQGSITVDGVSLTVAAVGDAWFEVALIPTTLERTTLGKLAVGSAVNIETDALARAVERLLTARGLILPR